MKFLKVLANIVLFLFMFIIIISYLGIVSVERTALSKSYYRGMVSGQNLIEDLHSEFRDILPDMITDDALEDIDPEEMMDELGEDYDINGEAGWEDLDESQREEIEERIREIVEFRIRLLTDSLIDSIDPEFIEENILTAIEEALYFLKHGDRDLDIKVDIKSKTDAAMTYFTSRLESLDENRKKELGIYDEDLSKITEEFFKEIDLPEKIDIGAMISESEEFQKIDSDLERYRTVRRFALILPYVFLAVIFVLFTLLSDIFRAMKRFGWGLFIPSFIFTASVTAGRMLLISILGIREEQMPIDFEIVRGAVSFTFNRTLLVPVIFIIISIILIASGIAGKRLRKTKTSAPAPENVSESGNEVQKG